MFTWISSIGNSIVGTLGAPTVLIFSLIGLVLSMIQSFIITVIGFVAPLLLGVLPISAAAEKTKIGKDSFPKVLGWLIAVLLYTPAASVVYAGMNLIYAVLSSGDNAQYLAYTSFTIALAALLLATFGVGKLVIVFAPQIGSMAENHPLGGKAMVAAGGIAAGIGLMAATGGAAGAGMAMGGMGKGGSGGGGAGGVSSGGMAKGSADNVTAGLGVGDTGGGSDGDSSSGSPGHDKHFSSSLAKGNGDSTTAQSSTTADSTGLSAGSSLGAGKSGKSGAENISSLGNSRVDMNKGAEGENSSGKAISGSKGGESAESVEAIQFQRADVIESENGSSEGDPGESQKDMKKVLNKVGAQLVSSGVKSMRSNTGALAQNVLSSHEASSPGGQGMDLHGAVTKAVGSESSSKEGEGSGKNVNQQTVQNVEYQTDHETHIDTITETENASGSSGGGGGVTQSVIQGAMTSVVNESIIETNQIVEKESSVGVGSNQDSLGVDSLSKPEQQILSDVNQKIQLSESKPKEKDK
jgi:hypothetical protein